MAKNKWIIFKYLIIIFSLFILSCGKSHYYQQSVSIPEHVWHYDSMINFVVPIDDSLAFYRLSFRIKHSDNYPYSNLWLRVILKCPCGAVRIDTVNLWLVDPENRWIGTAIGKTWTVELPFQDSVRFPSRGLFNFYIGHIMRKNDVPDIYEFSLIIDKLTNNSNSTQNGKR